LSNITSTSATITGLSNGTSYYFKIAAVNSGGTSAPSNEVSATPTSVATSSGSSSSGGGGGAVAINTLVLLGLLAAARRPRK